MPVVTRDRKARFIKWVVEGRTTNSPESIINVLKSDKTAREYPCIHWSRLQLLIIDWADKQCSITLRSGSPDVFADIGQLHREFVQYWKKHQLDFFAVYPEAQTIKWNIAKLDYLPQCLFEILLDDLTGSDDRTRTKMVRPYDHQRIRSNAYELSHYLLNLRQRMNANAAIIEQPRLSHMLKIHSKERRTPKRDIQFHEAICDYLDNIRYSELASNKWEIIQQPQGREWLQEVWGNFLNRIDIKEIAPFQLKCFRSLLDSALLADGCPEPIMITAGTGFGKTEAFLFPILFYATINLLRQKAQSYGPDAILVYPRIDLCNNQLERYMWYAHCLKESVNASSKTAEIFNGSPPDKMLRAVLGHSGALSEDKSEPFRVECPICKEAKQEGFIKLRQPQRGYTMTPFCTTDETNHDVKQYLVPDLKENCGRFTVAITTVDTLHRRLMDLHGRKTLWKHNQFLPRFIVLDEIHIYEGQTGSHVANLMRRLKVYLKNIRSLENERQPNQRPPIFVGASATIGNPQEVGSAIFGVSREEIKDRVLKPEEAESEPLGREYTYLLKTPPLREIQDDNNGSSPYRVVSEQASLLQTLMVFWHAMRKISPQQGIPGKYRLLTFVDSIDLVWRITRNLDDADRRRQLYKFRIPRGRWNNSTINDGNINCPKFACKEICETPPHQFFDRCGIYQQGECWWSMGASSDIFLCPMRIVGRISKFTESPQNLPRDQWDCMIATSTLEVGFDHSELIATAQFKAPPNPASFQ